MNSFDHKLSRIDSNLSIVKACARDFPALFQVCDHLQLEGELPVAIIWWPGKEGRKLLIEAARATKCSGWTRIKGREGWTWEGLVGGVQFQWEQMEPFAPQPEDKSAIDFSKEIL
jgi:hypothetical protein